MSAVFLWQPLTGAGVLMPVNPRQWDPWAAENPGWRQGVASTNPLMGDALVLTYPWRLYNSEMLRRGEIPLWNPHIYSGYPHLAALQSNALYPLTAVFDLVDPVAGIAWSMALHLALAGILMFFFLQRLGIGVGAATLGGVLFELNGFFLVRISAPSYVFSGIWAPLLFLGIEDMLRRDGWRSSWKVVLATAGALFGGHPQIFVLVMMMGGGYALLRAWPERPGASPGRVTRRFLALGAAVALGVAAAGVQLVPFLELLGETARSQVSFGSYQRLALPAVAFGQAVVPDLFGHSADGSYWLQTREPLITAAPEAEIVWGWNYCGENLFTGVAPLILALSALVRLRSRAALYFGAVAVVALLVLLGAPVILRLFYELVPSFQHSRADRIVYVYMVAVSILAALGWAGASGWKAGERLGARAVWSARVLVALPPATILFHLLSNTQLRAGYREFWPFALEQLRANGERLIPQAVAAAAVALATLGLSRIARRQKGFSLGLALVLIVVPLLRFGWRFNPVQEPPFFPPSPAIAKLRQQVGEHGRIVRLGAVRALPANVSQTLGFFDVNGNSAAALAVYVRLIEEVDDRAVSKQKYFRSFRNRAVLDTPLLDYLGVELVIGGPGLQLPELGELALGPGFRVYRNPQPMPRFFLVDRVEPYAAIDEGVRRFLSPDFEPRRLALVAASEAEILPAPGDPAADRRVRDSVRVVSYGAHEIELEVRAAGPRLLVSSEVDYPGWEVEVDGVGQRKVLVNTAFRGVAVAAGEHRVRFHFVPRSFHLGLGLTLLCGVGYAATLVVRRRRPAATESVEC